MPKRLKLRAALRSIASLSTIAIWQGVASAGPIKASADLPGPWCGHLGGLLVEASPAVRRMTGKTHELVTLIGKPVLGSRKLMFNRAECNPGCDGEVWDGRRLVARFPIVSAFIFAPRDPPERSDEVRVLDPTKKAIWSIGTRGGPKVLARIEDGIWPQRYWQFQQCLEGQHNQGDWAIPYRVR